MPAIIIQGTQQGIVPPFGTMTNNLTAMLYALNATVTRLNAAVGNAASGFQGTAGTEYEGTDNAFGIVASATPGQQGAAYAYAVNTIAQNWATFWAAAQGSIEAVDNGQRNVSLV